MVFLYRTNLFAQNLYACSWQTFYPFNCIYFPHTQIIEPRKWMQPPRGKIYFTSNATQSPIWCFSNIFKP
jgi:hypothetical protein